MSDFWYEPTPSDDLKELLESGNFAGRKTNYLTYENYYDGEQSTKLTQRQQDYLLTVNGLKYAENICDLIVDKMADKMEVQSFVCTPENPTASIIAEKIVENSMLDARLKTAVSKTIELGDGFLIVDWDKENNKSNIVYNHPNIVNVVYDEEKPDEIIYALKIWKTRSKGLMNPDGATIQRLNLYANDRVEKYYTDGEGGEWSPWIVDGELWPMPWTSDSTPTGEPLGIPVFHLKNNDRGKQFGTSELKKAVVLQNGLNKMWLDLFTVSDTQAYPLRWATGDTSTGAIKSNPGVLLKFSNPETRVGQWDAADMKQIIDVIQFRYRTIAAQTKTPFHELVRATVGNQSGESIKQAEQPLIDKVKDRQPFIGSAIGAAMKMAVKLEMLFGLNTPIISEDLSNIRFDIVWKPAQDRDEEKELSIAEAEKRLGIPMEIILTKLGYEDVESIMQKIDEVEQKRIDDANRQINSGLLPSV